MTFDSAGWREMRNALLHQWMKENQAAVDFLRIVFAAAELWDDLEDCEYGKARASAQNTMLALLLDLPTNPFYLEHVHELRAVMIVGINAWQDSVILEARDDQWAKVWAYALRDFYMELVPFCAMLIGGYDHMRGVSLQAREFFQAETFEEYINGRSA